MAVITSDGEYSYGLHQLQKVKVWNHAAKPGEVYVYIHGGAWRDPNNTFNEIEPVARMNRNRTFIGINYRLSPEVKHPSHVKDIYEALKFIHQEFDGPQMHGFGYSVGATMILQLVQFSSVLNNEPEVGLYFKSIKLLDGIYDVKSLLQEYPSYASFVVEAYSSLESAKDSISLQISKGTKEQLFRDRIIDSNTKIYVCQSLEDDLLSMNQTVLLMDFFKSLDTEVELVTGNWGKHDDIYGSHRNQVLMHGLE
ncbi:uncharacterized protein LODBEIA_P12960 [Lodderomyces beijingensis]|uniref:BD-FAE-like domain-containing protein n=1 Tax=Lodderomyces beijingensis TaxID=1775926 RepID=A0ABP0ZHZ8_9ASCO